MKYDAKIWGPIYWFFIHSVALTYPDYPNEVITRKYYDFFMNLPLFIPDVEMGKRFSEMLDKYPITPYLKSKDSLIRWTNFIHNQYNKMLDKEILSLNQSMASYFEKYTPTPLDIYKNNKKWRYYVHTGFILGILLLIMVYWG
jgi:hypothetical protein